MVFESTRGAKKEILEVDRRKEHGTGKHAADKHREESSKKEHREESMKNRAQRGEHEEKSTENREWKENTEKKTYVDGQMSRERRAQ